MELRWLEDFIVLARTQHFSRAAEEQNVTQPTFSRRIKLLEEGMGTTLINRQTLPQTIIKILNKFDVWRKAERLEDILICCQADHAGRKASDLELLVSLMKV